MSKISDTEKLAAINEYQKGNSSYKKIAKKYGIGATTLKEMIVTYESQGFKKTKNEKYSTEIKIRAITDYLSGKGSQLEICKKYKIRNRSQLREWIKKYNGHKEFREQSSAKGEIYMTKGRKTTQEERTEIVAFCIEHGKDYGLTTEKYKVSYQQIYSWVKKYEEKGLMGLTDRRGKAKPENELTEDERLRQDNKILKAKIKEQEMEIAILKKLRELRGGDW
jgi:transposase-like protein